MPKKTVIKRAPANYEVALNLQLINEEGAISVEKTRDRLLGEIGMGIGRGDLRNELWHEVLLIYEMGIARGRFLEQNKK